MTFTDLKKTEFWGAPRHWIGFWVKKKKRKEKRKKQPTTSSNTSTECHQHQERPVQIGRYPFRNHTSFSSVLLLVVYSLTQRTFSSRQKLILHAWALVILVAALRHSRVIATLAFVNAYHQTLGKHVGASSNPNIQQNLTQLLLPFSRKCFQGLQGFDTQLVRWHCVDLNPASAHSCTGRDGLGRPSTKHKQTWRD